MPVDSAASERPVTAELRVTTEDMLRLATRATDEEAIRDINLYLFGRSNGQSLHFYFRSRRREIGGTTPADAGGQQ